MRLLLILSLFAFTAILPAQLVGDTENGLASYYSDAYDGAETAYKVIYRKDELVAAHRQYPQNSVVRVKNIDNGKTVTVRIIDKGPFIRGRIIEVSTRAAAILGMLGKETVPVEITLLSTPDQPAVVNTQQPEIITTPEPEPSSPRTDDNVRTRRADTPPAEPVPETAERTPRLPDPEPAASTGTTTPRKTDLTTPNKPTPTVTTTRSEVKRAGSEEEKVYVRSAETFAPGTYKIELLSPPAGEHGVQVASFKELEKALDKVAELQKKWFDNILIQKVGNGDSAVYKVILGPFETLKSAQRYSSDLKKRYKIAGFTVTI